MNEKAYKFSVRDDTSFRVESGGGDSENPLSVCKVTIQNPGNGDVTIAGMYGVVENEGVKELMPVNRIAHDRTVTIDIVLIDGMACTLFSGTESINVDGYAEVYGTNHDSVRISGDCIIVVNGGNLPK